MSFSFHFSGADIEEDGNNEADNISHGSEQNRSEIQEKPPLIPPKRYTLQDLLQNLPSQISYNYLTIPPQTAHSSAANHATNFAQSSSQPQHKPIRVARRAIFDINAQLMAEADPTSADTDTSALLQGLNTGDLSTGIYEGGFKTWECAVDLAGLLAEHFDDFLSGQDGLRVIELGAGSGVPCLVVLLEVLRRAAVDTKPEKGRFQVTLCDYNYDVLRLGTAINVMLAAALDEQAEGAQGERVPEEDLELDDIDEEFVPKCLKKLTDAGVQVDFVSGAWGTEFVKLLDIGHSTARLLVVASETIYSPESLGVFTRTLLEILRSSQKGDSYTGTTVWVAAKKVYFGVGGGVAEFEQELAKHSAVVQRVLEVKGHGAGVGRVVLEIRLAT